MLCQLPGGLFSGSKQPQNLPATRVGQRFEYLIHTDTIIRYVSNNMLIEQYCQDAVLRVFPADSRKPAL